MIFLEQESKKKLPQLNIYLSTLFIKFKTTVGAVHLLGDVGVGLKSNSRSKEVWLGLVALSAERWP